MCRLFRRGLSFLFLALVTSACDGASRDASGRQAATSKPAAASWDTQPLNVSPDYWNELVSPEAWDILFRQGTEPPASSPLNDEHRTGTFVCAAARRRPFRAPSPATEPTRAPAPVTHSETLRPRPSLS